MVPDGKSGKRGQQRTVLDVVILCKPAASSMPSLSHERLPTGSKRIDLVALIGCSLPLRKTGRAWSALCPFHAERTASFTVWHDHYFCFGCGARGDAIDWLQSTRGLTFREALGQLGRTDCVREHEPAERPSAGNNRELTARIWREASDARGSLAEVYLAGRGLRLPADAPLRFHGRCPCGSTTMPAMVCLMSDPVSGEPTGVHRTFLRPNGSGKADTEKPKMMLGKGGIIQLYPLESYGLAIAEGIETALSVGQHVGWQPVWATGSTGGLRSFPVLPDCSLTVFADGDEPGRAAAPACAARWRAAGVEVRVFVAPDGRDANDIGTEMAS